MSSGGKLARHVRLLTDRGITVVALDMMGHGRSSGLHGFVPSIAVYTEHVHAQIATLLKKDEYATLPFFVMGHSMGGGVTLDYLATCTRVLFRMHLNGRTERERERRKRCRQQLSAELL